MRAKNTGKGQEDSLVIRDMRLVLLAELHILWNSDTPVIQHSSHSPLRSTICHIGYIDTIHRGLGHCFRETAVEECSTEDYFMYI